MPSFQTWIATGLALHNAVFGKVEAFPGRHHYSEVHKSYDFVIVGGKRSFETYSIHKSQFLLICKPNANTLQEEPLVSHWLSA